MDPVLSLPVLRRDAFVEGIDESTRTIRFRFSTGARRKTLNWDTWRIVEEELAVRPENVRLGRLKSGAPFLKDHRASMDYQIGVHKDAWIEADGAWGSASLFTDEDSEKCFQKIRGGAKNISVGYRVHVYEITERDGQLPLYRAVDWEPLENSLVAINADADAQIRSDNPTDNIATPNDLQPVRLIRSETPMTPEQIALAASQQRFTASILTRLGVADMQAAEIVLARSLAIVQAARAATGKEDASEVEGGLKALSDARTRAAQLEGENKALTEKLTALESESHKRTYESLVEAGQREGKLAPAMVTWARSICVREQDGKTTYLPDGINTLRGYLDVAVPVGPGAIVRTEATATGSATEPKTAPVVLTESDREVMARMHITEDQMRATKAAERK